MSYLKSATRWGNLSGAWVVSVSPIGTSSGLPPNNGANFGPDTPGTSTCGIQEAINSLKFTNSGILDGNSSISTDEASGTVELRPGMYYLTSQINLYQGLALKGAGRLSTAISLSTTPGSWLADMVAEIVVPANANECLIEGLTIIGNRNSAYDPYNIDGIRIIGYNWRTIVRDVEIQNCQGNGITTTGSGSSDVCYEPLFDHVSIIGCNAYGMQLNYVADDVILESNIENCSGTGIYYSGGDGNWVKLHVFANNLGMKIQGAPLHMFAPILDANATNGCEIDSISQTTDAGLITIVACLSQGNGSASKGTYSGIYLNGAQNVLILGMDGINKSGNVYQGYLVTETSTADYNTIIGGNAENLLSSTPVVLFGAHSSATHIVGWTPQPTTPGVPSSGAGYQNTLGYPIAIYATGGLVTAVTITKNGETYTVFSSSTAVALSAHSYLLLPGDIITFTYTTAPSWVFVPEN